MSSTHPHEIVSVLAAVMAETRLLFHDMRRATETILAGVVTHLELERRR